jgi:hypothetical protein
MTAREEPRLLGRRLRITARPGLDVGDPVGR